MCFKHFHKWGSCPSLPSAVQNLRLFVHLSVYVHEARKQMGGGGGIVSYLEICIRPKKNTIAVSLDMNVEGMGKCWRCISLEVFVWEMNTPETSAHFLTGKESISHFSLTIDSFFFCFSACPLMFFFLACIFYSLIFSSLLCFSRLSIQTNNLIKWV